MEFYSWFIPTLSGVEDNANTATLPYDEKVKLDEVDIAKETVQVENELPVKRSPLTVNRQSRVQETSSEEEDEVVFVEPTKPVEAAPPVTESTPATVGTTQQFSFEPEVIETKIAENKDESCLYGKSFLDYLYYVENTFSICFKFTLLEKKN